MAGRIEAAAIKDFRRLFREGSLAGLTSAELLERFAVHRDDAAFEAIVQQFGPMVLGVCRRTLGDPNDADDAFQATFHVLARRARSIRDGNRLGPWLFGVALKTSRRARAQAHRRNGREVPDVADLPAADPGPEDAAIRAEERSILDAEIARLPDRQRRLIVLCDLQGLTIEQAADCLGIRGGTARSRLARGRARLRSRLGAVGAEDRFASLLPGVLIASWVARPRPPAPLISKAVGLAVGSSSVAVGTSPPAALLLSQGILRTMMYPKFAAVAAASVLAPVLVLSEPAGISLAAPAREQPASMPFLDNDPRPDDPRPDDPRPDDPRPDDPRPDRPRIGDRHYDDQDVDAQMWKLERAASRVRYLRAAAENLKAAEMHDLALDLSHKADAMERQIVEAKQALQRELERDRPNDGPASEDFKAELRELREQSAMLREENERLRAELSELSRIIKSR